MFLLKTLGSLVWGTGKSELVKIEGELHKTPIRGIERCLYLHASGVIQRSPTIPHASTLVISRFVEEDVVDSSDPYEPDELSFLLAPELNLYAEEDYIAWEDVEGNLFRFVISDPEVNQNLLQLFELTALQALYEWVNKESPENASNEQLLSFRGRRTKSKTLPLSNPSTPPNKTPTASKSPTTPAVLQQIPPKPKIKPVFKVRLASDDLHTIFSVEAKLFWFNPSEEMYDLLAEKASVDIFRFGNRLRYFLCIHEGEKDLDFQQISSDMNPVFYHDKPLTFTYGTLENGISQSWGIKIDKAFEREFVEAFVRSLTETQRDESFAKLKEDEQRFIQSGFIEDEEMEDAPPIDSSDEEEEEEEEEEENYSSSSEKGAKNSILNVGFNNDRSFVVRGNQIGIFRHTDDSLEFSTSIKELKTSDNRLLSPSKTMLHDRDNAMILMNPNNTHKLYKLDLNYEKIVEEWKVDDFMDVTDICPQTKYAQKTGQETLVGMSQNAIFLIDPRISSATKRVTDMTKQYARESRNDFSSTATTENGELVVVSKKGDIRLYSDINKNAKTHLPGFGDPILGVDVTADGKWVLATCKTYLIIIPTEISGSDKTGFQKPMGQKKPIPKRLQLRPEHIVAMGSQPSFTPARFNVGEDEETSIITSSGPHVISWNFRRVKAGHLYDYRIKKYSDTVVADNFRYGQHKSIVVALPDDVTMVQKSKLFKPKDSLLSMPDS